MKIIFNSLKAAALIVLVMIFNVVPMVLLQRQNDMPLSLKWTVGLAYLVTVVVSLTLLWHIYQRKQDETIKNQKMVLSDWGYLALFWVIARAIVVIGTLINQAWSGQQVSANDAALQTLSGFMKNGFPLYTFLFIFVISFTAPVMEEMVFRGFPMIYFFKGRSAILGALVTSLIFSLPHSTNVVEFIMYACMGLVFFTAYHRRGNLIDSILLHIFNNFPASIALLLTGLGVL
ncbi:CPBP family intramembrane glutamic endopeptidase [Streptococcus castoreus]|uniref:CPBP family intramembrane glutamic endopeptidase n=1 Tax=Streptococcus castoreus TaxID=254786 RepID=UPI0004176CB4|nr:type II CAAX endopeptidase family protein [Streptococcus castoreus]